MRIKPPTFNCWYRPFGDDRNDSTGLVDDATDTEREEVEAIQIAEGQRAGREARERGGIDRNLPAEPDADDPFMGC